jgi:hypothetical protein
MRFGLPNSTKAARVCQPAKRASSAASPPLIIGARHCLDSSHWPMWSTISPAAIAMPGVSGHHHHSCTNTP